MEEHQQDKQEINQKKPNTGLIIAMVVVIVLAIGGVIGTWYYMNNKAKNAKKAQEEQIQQLQKQIDDLKKQSTAAAPAQTKSYTTKYDKLKFSYPNSWVLSDNSKATTEDPLGTGIPGRDIITISSDNGFVIKIDDGAYGIGGSCNDCRIIGTESINILGNTYQLEYQQSQYGNLSIYAMPLSNGLSPTTVTGGLRSKNLVTKSGDAANLVIDGGYKVNNKSFAELQADPNVQVYKNFLQSLSY